MKTFARDDGRTLRVVDGFREYVLAAGKRSVHPQPDWRDEDYSAAAKRWMKRSQRLLADLCRWGGDIAGARTLEVGAGEGLDCLLLGLHPFRRVVGVDLRYPLLFELSDTGERTRRLARKILRKLQRAGGGLNADLADRLKRGGVREVLKRLPIHFAVTDATRMACRDDSFDFLISRVALEHIVPVDEALSEMARVVRTDGLIFHSIDPYFWLLGCHKKGLADIPWAHARLTAHELTRFIAERSGGAKVGVNSRYSEILNQHTATQWRSMIEVGPFEILEWREERSPFAEALLEEHPDVEHDLLPGIERQDLICSNIQVWLRNKPKGCVRGLERGVAP
jgi:ubiquinone/menaquinone biosynthesis C-methylase UbiE